MASRSQTIGCRFGRVQVEMLECVYQHRLLSTAQLHALYRDGLSMRRTQRALAAMERVGWLASVRQPGGMKLWFVTERGADAVESIGNRAELRRKVVPPEQAAGPLQTHTLAVNEVGVAFVRAARERDPDEFGPLAWRNEIAHPVARPRGRRGVEMLIADAELTYVRVAPDRGVDLEWALVELDRATMALETLVAKLGRSVRLYEYSGPPDKRRIGTGAVWREHYPLHPAESQHQPPPLRSPQSRRHRRPPLPRPPPNLRHPHGRRRRPPPHLQEWMGHRDITTTQRYADYSPSEHEGETAEAAFARRGATPFHLIRTG
jgi:hypothetical protein